jgi:hypothetical protein
MTVKTAKVSAIYDAPANTAVDNNPANRGAVSAYHIVTATGFHGMRVFKRVRIGVEFGITVETAKDMMKSLREANSNDQNISGRFVMEM